ncbi:MAG: 6-phospho-3-hexuloisomerase [Actinomycetota bacterium]|nr:6-phospho-3-hexuloisomerase [Actinomycetota bacterium]
MYYRELLDRIDEVTSKIDPLEFKKIVDIIKEARRIYIIGAGRSGLVAKAFAMRLVHLRKRTFVVGETVVPAMRKQDILIAVSGSGRTKSVVEIAKTAKSIGGKVVAVIGDKQSELAQRSDLIVEIPVPKVKDVITSYDSRQLIGKITLAPLGSLFELSAMIFFECVIAELMRKLEISEEEMKREHTILE